MERTASSCPADPPDRAPRPEPAGHPLRHAGNLPGWGPFREKELVLTNVLSVLRPEAPFDDATMWAHPVTVAAEKPPGDVLAPIAKDAGVLTTPEAL